MDNIPSKVHGPLFEFGGLDQYALEDNAFYLRIPEEERQVFMFYGGGEPLRRKTLIDFEGETGYKNIVVDDPQFAFTDGKENPLDSKGEERTFKGDWIPNRDLVFSDLFTLHPKLKELGIGLKEKDFREDSRQ